VDFLRLRDPAKVTDRRESRVLWKFDSAIGRFCKLLPVVNSPRPWVRTNSLWRRSMRGRG